MRKKPATELVTPEEPVPARKSVTPMERMPANAVSGDDGHHAADAHHKDAVDPWHSHLAHVVRQAWAAQKIRIGVNNQLKRLERAGFDPELREAIAGLLDGLDAIEEDYKKRIETVMATSPLAAWIKEQPGIGLLTVGYILASTGPLTKFSGPYKVNKFLGMHVHGGKSPKRAMGEKAGWSQRGRMTCFQIGEAIVKCGTGPYNEIYQARRAAVLARARTGPSGCPFGHEHKGVERRTEATTGWKTKTGAERIVQCVKATTDPETGEVKETSAHVYADAKRVAVKAFLKELWRVSRPIKA
jgi:hypothetical protein